MAARATTQTTDHPIVVSRGSLYSRSPGNRRPLSNFYECDGPDGQHFTNTSIVTLRDVLRNAYGRSVVIVEPWKATSAGKGT